MTNIPEIWHFIVIYKYGILLGVDLTTTQPQLYWYGQSVSPSHAGKFPLGKLTLYAEK